LGTEVLNSGGNFDFNVFVKNESKNMFIFFIEIQKKAFHIFTNVN